MLLDPVFLGFVKQFKDAAKENEDSEIRLRLFHPVFTVLSSSNTSSDQTGLSRLASEIGKSMPESYQGEHLTRASALIGRQSLDFFQERFALMVYEISNRAWEELDRIKDYWRVTVVILRQSGLLRHQIGAALFGNRTITAFMENLFQFCLAYLDEATF